MKTAKLGAEPARSCNGCTLCCRLPEIEELNKPADVPCRHCVPAVGCAAYEQRPKTCRDFLCDWRTEALLDPMWDPIASHMMLYSQGNQKTVLVDPSHPDAWKTQPYFTLLQHMAASCENDGGYLILFCGTEIHRIHPSQTAKPPGSPTALPL